MKYADLGRMYIINVGPCFVDPKTRSKIHVLGQIYKSTLLYVIDASELLEILAISCNCAEQGDYLQSDNGTWQDHKFFRLFLEDLVLNECISAAAFGLISEGLELSFKFTFLGVGVWVILIEQIHVMMRLVTFSMVSPKTGFVSSNSYHLVFLHLLQKSLLQQPENGQES